MDNLSICFLYSYQYCILNKISRKLKFRKSWILFRLKDLREKIEIKKVFTHTTTINPSKCLNYDSGRCPNWLSLKGDSFSLSLSLSDTHTQIDTTPLLTPLCATTLELIGLSWTVQAPFALRREAFHTHTQTNTHTHTNIHIRIHTPFVFFFCVCISARALSPQTIMMIIIIMSFQPLLKKWCKYIRLTFLLYFFCIQVK